MAALRVLTERLEILQVDNAPERVEEQAVRLAGGGLFRDPDATALAAVGIDWDPRRQGGPGVHANGVFLPHSGDVMQCLRNARAEQQARHDAQIGVELLAGSLLSLTTGLVPPILAALRTPAATLRAAVTDACRVTGEPPQR